MWIGTFRCNFIQFAATSGTSDPISFELGIWYYRYWDLVLSTSGNFILESCHGYDDYVEMDDSWKAARAFSILTIIFAIIILVAICISACANSRNVTSAWEAPLYILTAISEGLTLLFLNSNACRKDFLVQIDETALNNLGAGVSFPETCSMGAGAKFTISSTVFFFVAAVSSYVAHGAEKGEIKEEEEAGLREPLNV